jgi:hypothetical protein
LLRFELRPQILVVQKGVFAMSNIHKPSIQVGHNLPDAADVNVAHGVPHVSPIAVQLHELTVFEKGDFDARRRRIDDEFSVHHMKFLGRVRHGLTCPGQLLLLVTVLAKTLLPLVRRHLVTLALFSAWHGIVI